jgi:hypothetical protein
VGCELWLHHRVRCTLVDPVIRKLSKARRKALAKASLRYSPSPSLGPRWPKAEAGEMRRVEATSAPAVTQSLLCTLMGGLV